MTTHIKPGLTAITIAKDIFDIMNTAESKENMQCSNKKIKRQCLTGSDDFREFEKKWSSLFDASANSTIFNSWEWLFSWWEAFGATKELLLLVWWNTEGTQVVGILPLYKTTESLIAGAKVRVLRMVGDGSYDSDYLDLMLQPDYYDSIISDFADWLSMNKEWDVAVFNTIPEQSVLPGALFRIAEKRKLLFRCEEKPCGRTVLPESFDAFLAELAPRFRTRLRALVRKFETDDTLIFENSNVDLKERLESLYSLHRLRWLKKGEDGVFQNDSKRLFYEKFVQRFADRGWLKFYSLRDKQSYLAHQLCFGRNDTTFLLQEGFDDSDSCASYGQMLRSLVFRFSIEKGEKVYDFLGGFSNHKASWGAIKSTMKNITLARKNWRGEIYFKKPVWRETIATMVKRILPLSIIEKLGKLTR